MACHNICAREEIAPVFRPPTRVPSCHQSQPKAWILDGRVTAPERHGDAFKDRALRGETNPVATGDGTHAVS